MIARTLAAALCAALLFSCRSNGSDAEGTPETADTSHQHKAPQPPPPDTGIERRVREQIKISPFKDLGCCADEAKRKTEPCCCESVVERYRQMRTEPGGKTDFAKLKTSDPILSTCKKNKKWRRELDLIDNPPPPPGTKPKGDDLL